MKHHLQYNWWKYIAILLLPVILWVSIFDILKKPDADERLHILYIGQSLDTAALEQQLKNVLPTRSSQDLKEIRVQAEQYSDSTVLTARCFDYDIILIEAPDSPESIGQRVFSVLTPELAKQFPEAVLYTENTDTETLPYGFILDPSVKTGFSACYTGTEKCYLFFSPESVNLDTCNGKGAAGHDGALQAAQYLLEITP